MRVVSGELRGRRLLAAPGRETRPTSDRAKAGLFDWIGPRVAGARVLDLFAGTGALGIEALSRGAREAVFVERSRGALRALRRNLDELALGERARVLERDLARGLGPLAAADERFDLVLADPPYEDSALAAPLALLVSGQLLAPAATVVVERSRRHPLPAVAGLVSHGSRRYGDTELEWLGPGEPPADEGERSA